MRSAARQDIEKYCIDHIIVLVVLHRIDRKKDCGSSIHDVNSWVTTLFGSSPLHLLIARLQVDQPPAIKAGAKRESTTGTQ